MKISFPFRVYLAALFVRIVPVLLTRSLGIGLDDMFQYDMLARSLAAGNGFRWYAQSDLKLLEPYIDFDLDEIDAYDPALGIQTSFRAPLYPAFLAIVYLISGTGFSRFFAARLVQVILLGAPLAPLTYFTAIRFLSSQRLSAVQVESASRRAAWTSALYPLLIIYPLGLGTENPFFLLSLLSFFLILRCLDQPKTADLILAGVVMGLTALTRSVILLFVVSALACIFLQNRRIAWIMGVAFLCTIAPWMVRNSLLHNQITGIETSMGYNLYLGYHPDGNGSFVFGPSLDLLKIVDDAERDSLGTRLALEFIREEPQRILPLAAARLGYFFGLEKRVLMYFYSNNLLGFLPPPVLILTGAVLLLPFVFISALSVFSLPFLAWNKKTALLVVFMAAYMVPHILILAEDRFHLVLVPFLAILASFFSVQDKSALQSLWMKSLAGRRKLLLSFILAALLFSNWGLELSRDADKIVRLLEPDGNTSYFPY